MSIKQLSEFFYTFEKYKESWVKRTNSEKIESLIIYMNGYIDENYFTGNYEEIDLLFNIHCSMMYKRNFKYITSCLKKQNIKYFNDLDPVIEKITHWEDRELIAFESSKVKFKNIKEIVSQSNTIDEIKLIESLKIESKNIFTTIDFINSNNLKENESILNLLSQKKIMKIKKN